MSIQFICICSGCGKEFPELERQLDGMDYCSTDCFMEYNSPCEYCGAVVPDGEGVYHKEEGYTLCLQCADGNDTTTDEGSRPRAASEAITGIRTKATVNIGNRMEAEAEMGNRTEVEAETGNETEANSRGERISLYEKNRRAVYATGNKWAIENWKATH
jgi:hypothetical protein